MNLAWEHAQVLGGLATVLAAFFAGIAVAVAWYEYRSNNKFDRRTVAHDKLNSLYQVAIEYPDLASGRIDEKMSSSSSPADMHTFNRCTWIFSMVQTTMEFLYDAYRNDPDWRRTIKYNMEIHKEFLLSDYHRENGWWSTYNSRFLDFLAQEVLHLPVGQVRAWAEIEVKDDELDHAKVPTT